ncbi:MAG: ABC transporter ATP-binding protein/permease [Paracoccaceae bacterium]|nr:ABC transporter ATP-binding protein/permease [Paracoccaceae bacterium]
MRFVETLIQPFVRSEGAPPQSLWAYGRWAFRGAERAIGLLVFLSVLAGIAEIVGVWLVAWVVDQVALTSAEQFFTGNTLALAAIAAFFIVLRPLLYSLNAAMNSRALMPSLYPMGVLRIHRHTLGQSLKFFEDDFAGRLSQKQIQSTYALVEIVQETVHAVVFGIATVAAAFFLLQGTDWRLGLILAVWFVLYLGLVSYFLPRIRARARARADAKSVVAGQFVDSLGHMATVKLFAHGEREEAAAETTLKDYRRTAFAFGRMTWAFRTWLSLLAGVLPVALIGAALYLWQIGQATPGLIAMAGLIATRLAQMSGWISFTALGIFANLGVLEDGIRTLTPPHRVTDAPDAIDPPPLRGDIRFENVSFHFGRDQGGGLDRFSLTVRAGEKVGLVGRSGAGKSTAVALLLRLYDVEEGRITVDGHDIRRLTQDGLRRNIATVTQEAAMFNRSALDNILYGRPEAGEADAIEAAQEAAAHAFIEELADFRGRTGYAARLGERGVKLSGGQRQRIALARVILKDAPVLVLDEATSALDSETEAAVQAALGNLMHGKTVIAIAHRLSTIQRMDRIVVMDEGRIVEEGSHQALLDKGGLYAQLWARQSGGFLAAEAAE